MVSTATRSTDTGTQKASIPLLRTVDGKYAGFALVNQAVRVGTHGYWMDLVLRPEEVPAPRRRPLACAVGVRRLGRSLGGRSNA